MDVRLPDGTIIQNVPDGMSKADFTAKLKANGYDVSKLESAPVQSSTPLPANAGLANFAASVAGLPVDTVTNAINLGIAGYGAAKTAITGKTGPDLIHSPFGGSESIKGGLRATGMPGLNPDNPQPNSKMGTAQYEFVSRGGAIPGGAIPAVGSMVAEKIGGPEWAAVGAMAPAAARQAVSSIPRPKLDANQELLNSEGVSMTPGQIVGGSMRRSEDAAISIPVLGDAIKNAQRRGIESFNAASINRALEPINERLPKNVSGHQAVEYARSKLYDAYDSLLPKLKGDLNYTNAAPNVLPSVAGQAAQSSLKQELATIQSMGQSLPPGARRDLNSIIKNEVIDKFTPQGLASGQTLKEIESELGNLSKVYRKSESYSVRQLGGAVDEISAAIRRMVNNVNPAYEGELSKINEGYANFKKVQAAASNIGAVEGVFTPAQLQRSVRAGDITKDKRAFSEGDALMQDLSQAGKSVLSQTVPDSGTPYRTAIKNALAHPLQATALGIPIAVGAAAYSSPLQAVIQKLLTSNGAATVPSIQELTQQAVIANQR
jgi:hypothetical protein